MWVVKSLAPGSVVNIFANTHSNSYTHISNTASLRFHASWLCTEKKTWCPVSPQIFSQKPVHHSTREPQLRSFVLLPEKLSSLHFGSPRNETRIVAVLKCHADQQEWSKTLDCDHCRHPFFLPSSSLPFPCHQTPILLSPNLPYTAYDRNSRKLNLINSFS